MNERDYKTCFYGREDGSVKMHLRSINVAKKCAVKSRAGFLDAYLDADRKPDSGLRMSASFTSDLSFFAVRRIWKLQAYLRG